jgi:hypothetical protein
MILYLNSKDTVQETRGMNINVQSSSKEQHRHGQDEAKSCKDQVLDGHGQGGGRGGGGGGGGGGGPPPEPAPSSSTKPVQMRSNRVEVAVSRGVRSMRASAPAITPKRISSPKKTATAMTRYKLHACSEVAW